MLEPRSRGVDQDLAHGSGSLIGRLKERQVVDCVNCCISGRHPIVLTDRQRETLEHLTRCMSSTQGLVRRRARRRSDRAVVLHPGAQAAKARQLAATGCLIAKVLRRLTSNCSKEADLGDILPKKPPREHTRSNRACRSWQPYYGRGYWLGVEGAVD